MANILAPKDQTEVKIKVVFNPSKKYVTIVENQLDDTNYFSPE